MIKHKLCLPVVSLPMENFADDTQMKVPCKEGFDFFLKNWRVNSIFALVFAV